LISSVCRYIEVVESDALPQLVAHGGEVGTAFKGMQASFSPPSQ